jgi:4-amino-4-deoxy-L-arabinose transferase-like glycosyltransferase
MSRRTAAILALCAAPRLLALALFPHTGSTSYDDLAAHLATTGRFTFDGVASTYMEPLYPAFLAAARLLTGSSPRLVLLLQIGVASIGGLLLYRLASRLAGARVGLIAACFYALDPYLVRQSAAFLDVTVCTTLAIATALSLADVETRRDAAVAGALFGLLMLTRASFGLACVATAFWLAARGRGRLAAVLVIAAVLVQAPWMVRNVAVDGSPLPSRLGENLYVSSSSYAAIVPVHDIDLLVPLALADVGPDIDRLPAPAEHQQRAIDDAMLARAIAFIRRSPGAVVRLKARNALYLFDPRLLPRYAKSPGAYAVVEAGAVRTHNELRRPWIEDASFAVARAVLLLLAAIGLVRRRTVDRDTPLLILLAATALVCVVFFPATRLMAPVTFVAMFYAAAGLEAVTRGRVTATSAAAPHPR